MLSKKHVLLSAALVLIAFSTGCVPDNFKYTKELGKSGSGPVEFLSPTDMDIDAKGNLVVADAGNTRFQVFSTEGVLLSTGGEFGVGKLKLQSVMGIGVDKTDGSIWVCDQKGNKVVKFSPDGSPVLRATSKMRFPMDVAPDRDGNIYVVMSKNPNIFKYDPQGNFIEKIGGSGKAALVFPTSINISGDTIYVTDFGSKRIVKLKLDGTYIEEIKSKGEYEEIKGPSDLHIDDKGNLYLLDLGEVPVVVLTPDGKVISRIGNFGSQEGSFLYPSGVVAKDSGEIYVLDNSRNTVLNFKKK